MTEESDNTPHIFQIGDRVERIEDRLNTSATVISIQEYTSVGGETIQSIEISYDEGESGWWPPTCLRPLITNKES